MPRELIADLSFEAEVIEWRGPAPFIFVAIPPGHSGEIRHAARVASYGWGCVPVAADVGGVAFETSLFPRNGDYLLPLKVAVRKQLDVAPGERVAVAMRIYAAVAARK